MSTHNIHVFISHSWTYSAHYNTLANWIFEQKWSFGQASLNFKDYSVPKDDPIHNATNDAQLQAAIFDKIARSHVVVIPVGMYVNRSKWIKKEIKGAQAYRKPILSVNPWGQERKSSIVMSVSSDHSGWNMDPLVGKIWGLYRQ
ncbi:nuclease [Epibacterium sp. SM1969]|uniref:Nuclease n=1 Tax=Tritonibacter aquimaris TaxID=2663379 RepID=A0A844AW42_9RHOB|nr:nuclease [Tritonibacter aquimaris]